MKKKVLYRRLWAILYLAVIISMIVFTFLPSLRLSR